MDWNLFWTISSQVIIGSIVLSIASIPFRLAFRRWPEVDQVTNIFDSRDPQ